MNPLKRRRTTEPLRLLDLPNEILLQITEASGYDRGLAQVSVKMRAIHLSGNWVETCRSNRAAVKRLIALRVWEDESPLARVSQPRRIKLAQTVLEMFLQKIPHAHVVPTTDRDLTLLWATLLDEANQEEVAKMLYRFFKESYHPNVEPGCHAEFARTVHVFSCWMMKNRIFGKRGSANDNFVAFGLALNSVALFPIKSNRHYLSAGWYSVLNFLEGNQADESALLDLVTELLAPDVVLDNDVRWAIYLIWSIRFPNRREDSWRSRASAKLFDLVDFSMLHGKMDYALFHFFWRIPTTFSRDEFSDFLEDLVAVPWMKPAPFAVWSVAKHHEPFEDNYVRLLSAFDWSEEEVSCSLIALLESPGVFLRRTAEALLSHPCCDPSFNGNKAIKLALVQGHEDFVTKIEAHPRYRPHEPCL